MAFLEINGIEFPCPSTGLNIIISTAVNAGRNANAEVIGEKIGRDVLKYDSLHWTFLKAEVWEQMLTVFDNFFVTAKVWDMNGGKWRYIKMYPGDRSAEVYWLETAPNSPRYGTPKNYKDCKVNIIDCGLLEDE